MKKIFCIAAMAAMMFGFVACNNQDTEMSATDTVATDTVECVDSIIVDSVAVDTVCAE